MRLPDNFNKNQLQETLVKIYKYCSELFIASIIELFVLK